MQDAQGRLYRFGPFLLDLQTRELRKAGVPVLLTPKAFDVLVLLVEHRERVVARDELLDTVWAGRVVEENNLTQAIAALRRAFGTAANDHRYIVTVPGRGYRFVADVTVGDEGADGACPPAGIDVAGAPAHLAPGTTASDAGPARSRRWLPAAAALVLAGVVALGWWAGRPAPPESAAGSTDPPAPGSMAGSAAVQAAVPGAASGSAQPLTLAVLPFSPLSGEAVDDALLGLGLADTLVTRVSGSTALRVRPLASSQRYGGAGADPLEAARALGVAYVVEGSTQRRGDAVRVNARLLAADGRLLWAGSFDAPLAGVFTLQDRIADELATALAVSVATPGQRSPCDGADAEAYRAYLSGQYRLARARGDLAVQAMADFHRALGLDPTCARAYAAMAQAYRVRVVTADTDPRVDFARASRLVDRALALDPLLAEAHLARGWIAFWHDWDWAASEAAFRRAIELNPSLADAHFGLAHLLSNTGREAEAAAAAREAMALDPLSPVINAIGAWWIAPPEEAVRYLDRALELDPDYWLARLMRGAVRIRAGDAAAGLADLDAAQALCGDCSHALAVRGVLAARAGNRDAARGILRRMQARDREGYWPASALATLHNALGDTDAALDQLERAWRERDLRMAFLRVDEAMRWPNLRDEPRYRALVQRMGFPPGEGAAALSGRTHAPASATPSAADRSNR